MSKLLTTIPLFTIILTFMIATPAFAAPVYNPENGHYYDYIYFSEVSWTLAKLLAEASEFEGVRGHLVTITSQSENDFVSDLIPNNFRPWIGLSDKYSEGNYKWVTGEPFDYSNWSPSQPDNHNNEDYVEFYGFNHKWNDNSDFNGHTSGYIIEYTPTNIVQNRENGHFYELVHSSNVAWTVAKYLAENSVYSGINGHLVTITSQSENDFVADLSQNDFRVWIGLTDEDTKGNYQWVTGEQFSYSNWSPGEPTSIGEDYVEFFASNDKWNDNVLFNAYTNGYVVEYALPNPIYNPENGHYYQLVSNLGISWVDAKRTAEAFVFEDITGHLVTITSESENDFVAGLVPDDSHAWIGLTDVNSEGEYFWVTGESVVYFNWSPSQPDNYNDEDFGQFIGFNDRWNDNTNNNVHNIGYVVEFSP